MIDVETARGLLDFDRQMNNPPRAEEQLRGAVAIHNILREHRVAYLADEVGMGKTYVALGALALFRHFDPSFRVLIIAPRENIQRKWQKEISNFASDNVRFEDMRMVSLDRRPARPLASCESLVDLVNKASLDPDRDFFVRMSSFSLHVGNSSEDWKRMRQALRRDLPWLRDEALDLRSKEEFKKNFARALCCALPKFDLVIVDEAHNLKHGFSMSGSARNQVLAHAFGRSSEDDQPDKRLFPGYGPRAERLLFLSATPLEESYRHVWNQLDLFGLADKFPELRAENLSPEKKKNVARKFLVRRVTTIKVAGDEHTKNMYRREWRSGGVIEHDNPIRVEDDRQRLIVALVQKKVSELLDGKKFNRSFQVGMLASFESFLETARLKRDDDDQESVFDDPEQTEIAAEREGLDVRDLNRLARDYRKHFNSELPHPKMDALVESLASSWITGKKALVFVRRVASVKEIKRKLDDRYDAWLIPTLRARLPEATRSELDRIVATYRAEREAADAARRTPAGPAVREKDTEDRGGHDTFFAWFFRGEGPKGWVSGADVQARFNKASGAYATFFADNHVMDLLAAAPGGVIDALAAALGRSRDETVESVRTRSTAYLSKKAKVVTRGARMEAAQAAALELLKESEGAVAERAAIVWEERYQGSRQQDPASEAPRELAIALERPTFFTELRRPERADLRARIWPDLAVDGADPAQYRRFVRERELRAQYAATAARLGHSLLDLYVVAMASRTTLAIGRGDDPNVDVGDGDLREADQRLIASYLDLLDAQRLTPPSEPRPWGAFDELSEIGAHFDLIVAVNTPDARNALLGESTRMIGTLLRQQMPVAGMAGQVNQTVVRQFRMPGYPFVLVSTDLLQEGEDLHTFCSAVYHYGISWTPSAMEQRIGRIDRVRSQTDRRLSTMATKAAGGDWLQVFYPYLEETVEVLQVERVLHRMNEFLRLMHEGLAPPDQDQRRIDISKEMLATRRVPEVIREHLKTAFPLPDWALQAKVAKDLAVQPDQAERIRARFRALGIEPLPGVDVTWAPNPPRGALLGTAKLRDGRQQPFTLLLRSDRGRPLVRCVSPIGRTDPESDADAIAERAARTNARIGAILTPEERSYDLTIEEDVLLAEQAHDRNRVATLVRRVTEQADRMEREHFEDGRDQGLDVFERDLAKEGGDAD
jgi:hypothetical protein